MKSNKYFSLKYAVYILLIIMIMGNFFITIFYSNSNKLLNDSLKSQLSSNLGGVAFYIDVDLHKNLREKYSSLGHLQAELIHQGLLDEADIIEYGKQEMAYVILTDKLIECAEEIGVESIYTIAFEEDYVYYIFNTDTSNPSFIGKHFHDLSNEDEEFYRSNFGSDGAVKVLLSSSLYKESLIGTVTLYDSEGNAEALLCISLSTEYLAIHRFIYLLVMVLFNGGLVVFFILLGGLLFLLIKRNNEMQKRIETLAYYDSLTSLHNRTSLIERVKKTIELIDNRKLNCSLALCMIDIDNFKQVNDSEGHIMGDILLQKVAGFLKEHSHLNNMEECLGEDFVARLGGDEFVIICLTVSSSDLICQLDNIISDFNELRKNDRLMDDHDISLSIGVSLYPNHADNISNLLKTADLAMYEAKHRGKGQYVIFES